LNSALQLRRLAASVVVCAVALVGLTVVTLPKAQAAGAAAAFQFVDLGVGFTPSGVNSSHEVVGAVQNGNSYVASVWQNGTLSPLPGGGVSAVGVDDAGRIVGIDSSSHPLRWANASSSPAVGSFTGSPGGLDQASGYTSWVDTVTRSGLILDATGRTVLTTPVNYWPQGLSRNTFIERFADLAANQYHWYLVSTATGAKLADLPNWSSNMASDGSTPSDTGIQTNVRLPDGTIQSRPITGGVLFINAQHDLASSSQVLLAGTDTPINLQSVAPAGWTVEGTTALGDNGDIVARCLGSDGLLHGCLLQSIGRPVASYTTTPDPTTPGHYTFASTSTAPGGGTLKYAWDLGDGTTSTTATVDHKYLKPGTYTVSLTVTLANGTRDNVTNSLVVAAPMLTVKAVLHSGVNTLRPADNDTLDITVAASKDGLGDLTLAVTKPLSGDTPTVATLGTVTPKPVGFTLAPGATSTYSVPVSALKVGATNLSMTVAGKDAAGAAVTADLAFQLRVQVTALDLAIKYSQDTITLAEDKNGPTPQTLSLTVTATNTSTKPITQVVLFPLVPQWQAGFPFATGLPNAVIHPTDGPTTGGLAVGDIAPGANVVKTFHMQVTDDGHVKLSLQAGFVDGDGSNRIGEGEAPFVSVPKYLYSFRSKADASVDDNPTQPWNTPDAVSAGNEFLLTGGVKNLTTDQRLILTIPAVDQKFLSAPNLGPIEKDWQYPSLPYRLQLDPADSAGFQAHPVAVPAPARDGSLTYAQVTYAPVGRTETQDSDASLTEVTGDRVLSTPEDLTVRVPIVWEPPVPAPTPGELVGIYTGNFAKKSAAFWGDTAYASGQALISLGEIENQAWKVITGDPVAQTRLRSEITATWASWTHTLEMAHDELATLSNGEKVAIAATLANPFLSWLAVGRLVTTTAQREQATAAIESAVLGVWEKLSSISTTDPRTLAADLGGGTAVVFGDVTVAMITDAAMTELFTGLRYGKNLKASQAFIDAQAEAAASSGLKIEKGLKGIPAAAALTDEVLTVGVGLTSAQTAQIEAVAKRFNLVVYVRSRASGAADLISQGLARLKPFGIDAKSVNDIDRLLGFPASVKDTVAIMKPKAWADVLGTADYQALNAEQRAQVAARWQTRSKEWNGAGKLAETSTGSGDWVQVEAPGDAIGAERAKFLAAADKGTFDLQFPTAGNWEEVATNGQALGTAQAKFSLKTIGQGADEVLQPFMSDSAGGHLLPIGGDVDLVALLNPNGTWPDPDKIIAAYGALAQAPLRMQHPATWSFNVAGKSMSLLEDHLFGSATAEPLAAFYPTGQRNAVLFDKNLSLIPADRASNPALFVQVAGGIQLPQQSYGLGAALPLFLDQNPPAQNSYYTPENWATSQAHGTTSPVSPTPPVAPLSNSGALRSALVQSVSGAQSVSGTQSVSGAQAAPAAAATPFAAVRQVTASTAGVRYVRGAAPVEEAAPDRLVRYASGVWATWSPPAGPFAIAPQTCLAKPLLAGQRTASVCSLASLFPNTGVGGQQWFAVGDTISVDLRGSTPFSTKITALSATSITFADPAPLAVLPGTAIQLVAVAKNSLASSHGGGGILASTGFDAVRMAGIALLLLVIAAACLAAGRRRRRLS
jgi:PKD repeat protein